jgi:hypothetical protein
MQNVPGVFGLNTRTLVVVHKKQTVIVVEQPKLNNAFARVSYDLASGFQSVLHGSQGIRYQFPGDPWIHFFIG